jgi:hypothetical protein
MSGNLAAHPSLRLRRLTAAIAAALVSLLWLSSTAAAQELELPPGGTFTDDDETSQEGHIEAIAASGITRGCNPPVNDRFCPRNFVTRGQVASFLVRALQLPSAEVADQFVDDDESPHAADIDSLVAAGITRGCGIPEDRKFCPDRPVSRGEMAAFLVRAFDFEPPAEADPFVDDNESVFEQDIEALAAAGVTSGCGSDTFCPDRPILRANLAVFLVRALQLEPIIPPPRPRVIGEFTTRYKCCESRVTNIHLIADTVDGAVVQPGETWSINEYVGRRTAAKGYVPAGAIIGGELICCDHPDNIGGGTSQFATTLYNAIYFAGLEDVTHQPHSIYFSRYPLGHEATLGWTTPDLVFRNDTEYPITIETGHTSTSVTVQLVGFNGGRKVQSSVSGSATTSAGGTVTVWRTISYPDGQSETQTWTHHYNPIPQDDDGGGGGDPDPPPGPTPL